MTASQPRNGLQKQTVIMHTIFRQGQENFDCSNQIQ